MNAHAVAVYGATGHTGRFVVRELERRDCPTVLVGRNQGARSDHRLGDARHEYRSASCDDPDALDEALRGTSAVINCAGPFLDTAPALVEAALRAGIHYFDVTAEQRSVRQTLATYHEEARQRRTVVVPAMAFFGGLADLLATETTHAVRDVESIEIAVALDYWHPTMGTRRTGDRNSARRLILADGKLVPVPRPATVREWTFPEPFGLQEVVPVPMSEIMTISRHTAARDVCSYMSLAPLRDLENPRTPLPIAIDRSGRSSQLFVMDVHAISRRRRTRISAIGHDIYAVTAPIVVEACLRVLEDPPTTGGGYAPAQLFDSSGFLASLAPHLKTVRAHERWQVAAPR